MVWRSTLTSWLMSASNAYSRCEYTMVRFTGKQADVDSSENERRTVELYIYIRDCV